jgi:hypothetical protein
MILLPILIGYAQTASTHSSTRTSLWMLAHNLVVFSALRIFAISRRNNTLAVIVLILGFVPVAVNSVCHYVTSGVSL